MKRVIALLLLAAILPACETPREQFERRTHKRLIDILNPNQKAVEALMSLDLPAGVEIEIKL